MKTLFDKTNINGMEIKNRFFRAATWEGMADEKGHLTDKLVKLYEDLAKGGAGVIITGGAYITEDSKSLPNQIGIYNDEFIEEYKKLTTMIHKYRSKIFLEVAYATLNGQHLKPTDILVEDIKTMVSAYGKAAERAEKAGFDGVELHAAHGFFLSQFLNSTENKRTDEYGGSIENNSRIILEIYDEIRKVTSKNFSVIVKVNGINKNEDDDTFETCKYACIELSKRGIDAIEISGGRDETDYKESIYRDYAAEIAEEVEAPIILVGKNRNTEVMDQILNTTKINYFSLSRPFISQPDLVNLLENNLIDKPKCISCDKCMQEDGISCIFNR